MRFVVVAVGVGVVAACASTEPSRPPEPALNVPPVASAPAPQSPPRPLLGDLPDAKAWTEPGVIDRLAADCRWQPSKLDQAEVEDRNPMSCKLVVAQSCVPDPCFDENESECKPACAKTCAGCASSCTSKCEACKAPCKDDACRRACAEQCGKCREACIAEVDHCDTAACSAKYDACSKKTDAALRAPKCRPLCVGAQKCIVACKNADPEDPCYQACAKKFAVGCPEKSFWYCVQAGGPPPAPSP